VLQGQVRTSILQSLLIAVSHETRWPISLQRINSHAQTRIHSAVNSQIYASKLNLQDEIKIR